MSEKKRTMTVLEYSAIVREFQILVGKRFDNLYFISDGKYRLHIGDKDVVIEPGVRFHFTRYIEANAELDNFSKKVRKELGCSFLRSVTQINNDRIILMEFDSYSLFMEMFSKGNMVLVRDGKTIACVHRECWADRETRPGKPYQIPRSSATTDSVASLLSSKYIIVSLIKLPLGKQYILEALRRVAIEEKTPGNSLSKEQISKLQEECERIKKSCQAAVFFDNNHNPADFGLTAFSHYHESKQFSSLSEAADFFYQNYVSGPSEEVIKIRCRFEEQTKRLTELREMEILEKQKGDLIYKNYDTISAILADKSDSATLSLKINKKEKSVELDL